MNSKCKRDYVNRNTFVVCASQNNVKSRSPLAVRKSSSIFRIDVVYARNYKQIYKTRTHESLFLLFRMWQRRGEKEFTSQQTAGGTAATAAAFSTVNNPKTFAILMRLSYNSNANRYYSLEIKYIL